LGYAFPPEGLGVAGREVTGTEWEFEDAIQGYEKTKEKPFILVFQKVARQQAQPDTRKSVNWHRVFSLDSLAGSYMFV
jgi:hypothetical protein